MMKSKSQPHPTKPRFLWILCVAKTVLFQGTGDYASGEQLHWRYVLPKFLHNTNFLLNHDSSKDMVYSDWHLPQPPKTSVKDWQSAWEENRYLNKYYKGKLFPYNPRLKPAARIFPVSCFL